MAGVVSGVGGYTMGVGNRLPVMMSQAIITPTPTIEVIHTVRESTGFGVGHPPLISPTGEGMPPFPEEKMITLPSMPESVSDKTQPGGTTNMTLPKIDKDSGSNKGGSGPVANLSGAGSYISPFSKIGGSIISNFNGLDHIDIILNKWEKGKTIVITKIEPDGRVVPVGNDYRIIKDPQAGFKYEYVFADLEENTVYMVNVLMCSATACITKADPVGCSGLIDVNNNGGCVTTVPGVSDFILSQWPFSEAPIPTPTLPFSLN